MTLTQKILAAHARNLPRPWVQAGDVLQVSVDWTIASELAWNGMERTYSMLGRPKLHDRDRFFLAVDHTVDPVTLATDKRAQKLVQLSRDFARESGIRHFYDANQTILHTRFYRDLVRPGDVVLGADSHTSSHGGLGAVAVGLGGADIVVAMVLGSSWIQVPEAIAVEYSGALPFGIAGKDVILRTLGLLGRNTVAMERSVEYRGEGVRQLSTDSRFAIANMTAEFGGLNGIFEADEVTAAWLAGRADADDPQAAQPMRTFRADAGAPYAQTFEVDLANLEPQVAVPFSPDNVKGVTALAGTELQGLFIGACTTTEEELVLAALVLEAAGVSRPGNDKQIVVPGDLTIQENLRRAGLWSIYERAGFRVDPPGCSMCLGVASRKAGRGEKWLSSQNRNFENRMGDGSLAHLGSAATVAASAQQMKIADPRPLLARIDQERFRRILAERKPRRQPEIQVVDPQIHLAKRGATAVSARQGRAADRQRAGTVRSRVQRFGDNVDTDAIIPGQFCHLTALSELGAKAFHFVRPDFVQKARDGARVIVAGEGWGSGSSREQAVLALKGAGIEAIVAKSYAFIHKRNLVNEALPFLVVQDARFHELAREGEEIELDLARGAVRVGGEEFAAEEPSRIVQALVGEGGIVPAIQHHGTAVFEKLTA
ncbi:MAG: 3-isopropylmalate dehydratase [Deltaproteobacteria bacterium]|nr:MAG: 3-isopropylmalate dehydratase [Deltaproteobacteria bacterium]